VLEAAGRVAAPVPTMRSAAAVDCRTGAWKLIAVLPWPAAGAINDEDVPARLREFK
jgi:hypothetical protein